MKIQIDLKQLTELREEVAKLRERVEELENSPRITINPQPAPLPVTPNPYPSPSSWTAPKTWWDNQPIWKYGPTTAGNRIEVD